MKLSLEVPEQDLLHALAAAINAKLGPDARLMRWNLQVQRYTRTKQWVAVRNLRVVASRTIEMQS